MPFHLHSPPCISNIIRSIKVEALSLEISKTPHSCKFINSVLKRSFKLVPIGDDSENG